MQQSQPRRPASLRIGWIEVYAKNSHAQLGAVLQVVHLVFNEGYSSVAGAKVMRVELTSGAIRLASC